VARIGIAEITLVTVILLLLAPDAIPRVLRTIGRYVGALRKMSRDVEEQVITPMMGESASHHRRAQRGDATRTEPSRESPDAKLKALAGFSRDYRPQHARQALLWILDDDPAVRLKAQDVLSLDPLFAFEYAKPDGQKPDPDRPLTPLEQCFSAQRIRELSDALAEVSDERLARGMEGLCRLPGIEHLDRESIFSGAREAQREQFLQARARWKQDHHPPQIPIAPSFRQSKGKCALMSAAEFGETIDQARRTGSQQYVSLTGDDPAMYPRMAEYIGQIEAHGLSFHFTTNGLAPVEAFGRVLASSRLDGVTFRVEKDAFYRGDQRETLCGNIRSVDQERVTVVLRYALSDRENRDWAFLKRYIDLLTRPNVSFMVTLPDRAARGGRNLMVELQAFAPKVVAFTRCIKELTHGRSRRLALDAPFPPCLFGPSDLQFLLRTVRMRSLCEPDGNEGTQEQICQLPHCHGCLLHARGACQGVCLPHA
jgi:Sec-independent protein translocase protein TatA/organic radical activating enzyme